MKNNESQSRSSNNRKLEQIVLAAMKAVALLACVMAFSGCQQREQDHYAISIAGDGQAYKINKQTGEVWFLHRNTCVLVMTNHVISEEELLRGIPIQTNTP